MKLYWVTASGPGLGCGVTAIDEADCRGFVERAKFFTGRTVMSITELKSTEEIEQSHVVPNMGNMFARGIWFPRGV